MPRDPDHSFASRGGLKLDAALNAFALDVAGRVAADLGCSTGGFVDCLLQRGAVKVHAVDTAYGQLAWKLRQDPRVEVHERQNALHFEPVQPVEVVTVDLGWTKQDRAVPAALRWLKPDGRIITLIKPHYEAGQPKMTGEDADAESQRVVDEVLPELGVEVLGLIPSPIPGGKGGNREHLALLRRMG